MSFQANSWEQTLIDRAFEGLDFHAHGEEWWRNAVHLDYHDHIDYAYRRCEEITRENSRTFHLASSLLPPQKRRAVRALYAFCRLSDDLVDRSLGDQYRQTVAAFESWRYRILDPHSLSKFQPENSDLDHWLVTLAWSDTRHLFDIPHRYVEQLLEGIKRDLNQTRYRTFEEVVDYSYGVASTVGLMSMHIVGFNDSKAIPYAVRLGVALQLTNILRDVGEDWQNGRLYLPLEELEDFGLSELDIELGRVNEAWRRFMRFQIERVHRLYDESMPGIHMLHPDGRFSIAASAELYRAIIHSIEINDYDVFSRRAAVPTGDKLRRLPRIWWQWR